MVLPPNQWLLKYLTCGQPATSQDTGMWFSDVTKSKGVGQQRRKHDYLQIPLLQVFLFLFFSFFNCLKNLIKISKLKQELEGP